MNWDNDELIIKDLLNGINTPGYNIASEIEKNKVKKSPSFKRHLVTAAALLMLLTFTFAAAAATISGFKYLVSIIGEENAGVVSPVELSDEDRGIKMEVVASGRFDNMLKIYVTLQDLTGERLADDIKLSPYSLDGIDRIKKVNGIGGSSVRGWDRIDYDEQNHKATLLYEYNSSDKLEGEELTLKIDKILYNTKEYWNYKVTEADLSKADRNPHIFYASMEQFLSTSNIGILEESIFKNYAAEDAIPILKEQADKISFPQTEGFNICAVGVVDGKLHIQTQNFEIENKDTNYNIYFVDLKNPQPYHDLKNPEGIFRFDLDEDGNITKETDFPAYEEYVFDIDTDRLEEYELLAYIRESDAIKGEWEVKFSSEDSGEILKTQINKDVDGIRVDSASVNPFGGIRIEGTVDNHVKIPVMFNVKINTSRGEMITTFSSYDYLGDRTENSEYNFEAFYETEKPVDLNSVISIEINGVTTYFER
jgi:hypothetical protein